MTIIVKDSFNRVDSNSLGVAETGQTWTYSNKPYGIRSNEAFLYLNGTTSFDSVTYVDSGLSDCKVTWKIATYQASNSRLIFRYVDFSNYLAIEPRASDIRIYKKVANTTTTVGTFAHSSASGNVITVEMTGSTVKVYVNGTLKTTVTITELTTATRHGMFANNTEVVRYDDFMVEDFNVSDPGTDVSVSYATKNVIYRDRDSSFSSKQQIYTDQLRFFDSKLVQYKDDVRNYSAKQVISKELLHSYSTKQVITLVGGKEVHTVFPTKQQVYLVRSDVFATQQAIKGRFYKTLNLYTSSQSEIKLGTSLGDTVIEIVSYMGQTVYQPNTLRTVSEMEVIA